MFRLSLICLLFVLEGANAYSTGKILQSRLDPAVKYETIVTPHFQIHFPEHLRDAAISVAGYAEGAKQKVESVTGWAVPGFTHIVVSDRSDYPSPFTVIFPDAQIFFDVNLPPLSKGINEYANWHDWLLTHEYTHIAQFQMTGEFTLFSSRSLVVGETAPHHPGLAKRRIGGVDRVKTHAPWARQGQHLSDDDAHGSPRKSSGASSFARKDTIYSLDDKNWPWTMRPYLFGYYLMETVDQKSGSALADLLRAQAKTFPYYFVSGLHDSGFASFDELWESTMRRISENAERQIHEIKKEPITELEYITDSGQLYHGLVLSPDGRSLLVTQDHPDFEFKILKFDIDADRFSPPVKVTSRSMGTQTSFSRSGRFIAFDETTLARRHYQISDITIFDLKENKPISISPYLRARDPDIHPDESACVCHK